MTDMITRVILNSKKGLMVRKGEAMLQIFTNSFMHSDYKYDLQGTTMPSAKEAEWLIRACLNMNGPSGFPEDGDAVRANV